MIKLKSSLLASMCLTLLAAIGTAQDVASVSLANYNYTDNAAFGGTSREGNCTITLTSAAVGDVHVAVSSDNPNLVIQSDAVVGDGETSVTIPFQTPTVVPSEQTATVTAGSASDTFGIHPMRVTRLTTPSFYFGRGTSVTGILQLAAPVATDQQVTLSAPAPLGLTSTTVTVPAGSFSAVVTFNVAGDAPRNDYTVTASYNGMTFDRVFKVVDYALQNVVVTPKSVIGGNSITVTIKLTHAVAVNTAVNISLLGVGDYAQLPGSTVTVLAGTDTVSFQITTSAVGANRRNTLRATLNTSLIERGFTVTPS
jgi:hypothetical protein